GTGAATGVGSIASGTNISASNSTGSVTINFVNPGFVTAASSVTWTAAQTVSSTLTVNATATFVGNVSTSIANALLLGNGSGILTAYGGSSCSGGQAPNGVSATGTLTGCFTPAGGSGAVSTSSLLTAFNFPYWSNTTGGLNGTS